MWKRHPLTRFSVAMVVGVAVAVAVILLGLLDPKFWADTKAAPGQVEGVVSSDIRPSTAYVNQGHFEVISNTQSFQFDVNAYIIRQLVPQEKVRVTYSPNLLHVYSVDLLNTETTGKTLVQDNFEPNALFQSFQAPGVYILIFALVVFLGAVAYAGVALFDCLARPVQTAGTITARLEQADFNAGFGLIVRPFKPRTRSRRFYLAQPDFLKTDGAEFVEISHTPVFHYVKKLRLLAAHELPADLQAGEVPASFSSSKAILLHYLSKWQFVFFLYSDLVGALILLVVPLVVIVTTLPTLLEPGNRYGLYGRILLPFALALLALIMSVFLALNFWRKWRDLQRPKQLTEGPVLSKWRVNGVSNENRRQIVVAAGGLDAGSDAVHKFDISAHIYDELHVGDVVKIVHTPRLRFILRLEVTGHQELAHKN